MKLLSNFIVLVTFLHSSLCLRLIEDDETAQVDSSYSLYLKDHICQHLSNWDCEDFYDEDELNDLNRHREDDSVFASAGNFLSRKFSRIRATSGNSIIDDNSGFTASSHLHDSSPEEDPSSFDHSAGPFRKYIGTAPPKSQWESESSESEAEQEEPLPPVQPPVNNPEPDDSEQNNPQNVHTYEVDEGSSSVSSFISDSTIIDSEDENMLFTTRPAFNIPGLPESDTVDSPSISSTSSGLDSLTESIEPPVLRAYKSLAPIIQFPSSSSSDSSDQQADPEGSQQLPTIPNISKFESHDIHDITNVPSSTSEEEKETTDEEISPGCPRRPDESSQDSEPQEKRLKRTDSLDFSSPMSRSQGKSRRLSRKRRRRRRSRARSKSKSRVA